MTYDAPKPISTCPKVTDDGFNEFLLYTENGWFVGSCDYNGDWYDKGLDEMLILPTHWLPLPPKPETDELP